MANRNFNRYQALTKEAKCLFAKAAIGATGAPTLSAADSLGVASIARTGVGAYTVTLQDRYSKFLFAEACIQLSAGSPVVNAMVVRSEAVNSATPTIAIAFVDGSGAAAEIPSGATLRLKCELKNSSV
jgi:hypothetical protein